MGRRRGGRRHVIADSRLETAAGVAALVIGWVLLRDAYEGRARQQPLWLRPVAWW